MEKNKSLLREYAEALLLALLLALFIRSFVVQAFRIPSGSMIPALLIGDQILVDKVAYRLRKPVRGEIVVFKYPRDESRDFIKRVIGLPGEKLEVRKRVVYINGEPINDEDYAYHRFDESYPAIGDNFGPVDIPPDKYFVMGDNRENSQDSRFWGFLDENKIIGRAFIIYWSRDTSKKFPQAFRWNRFAHLF